MGNQCSTPAAQVRRERARAADLQRERADAAAAAAAERAAQKEAEAAKIEEQLQRERKAVDAAQQRLAAVERHEAELAAAKEEADRRAQLLAAEADAARDEFHRSVAGAEAAAAALQAELERLKGENCTLNERLQALQEDHDAAATGARSGQEEPSTPPLVRRSSAEVLKALAAERAAREAAEEQLLELRAAPAEPVLAKPVQRKWSEASRAADRPAVRRSSACEEDCADRGAVHTSTASGAGSGKRCAEEIGSCTHGHPCRCRVCRQMDLSDTPLFP